MTSKDHDKLIKSFRQKLEELDDKQGEIVQKSPLANVPMHLPSGSVTMADGRKMVVQFHAINFSPYNQPSGWLINDRACHALFYYYLIARNNYEREMVDPIVIEGHVSEHYDYKGLFQRVAQIYGVDPERMLRFWSNVNMQAEMMALPLLPDEDRYRHNAIMNVK